MTDLWDSEAAEYLDDEGAEWYDDGEDVDFGDDDVFGEAKSEAQKRREAAQRRAAATRRRRAAIERRSRASRSRAPARPMTPKTAILNTRAAVKRVDLENQVRADALAGAVSRLRTQTTGLTKTVSAAAVTNTVKNELDKFSGDDDLGQNLTNVLKTIVDFVPLLFVKSDVKGYRSPPVAAAVAAGVITITGLLVDRLRDDDGEFGGGSGGGTTLERVAGRTDDQQVSPSRFHRPERWHHGSSPARTPQERCRR